MQYIAMGALVAISEGLPISALVGIAAVALSAAGLDLAGRGSFIASEVGLARMAIDLACFGLFYLCAKQKIRLGSGFAVLRHIGLRCYGLYLIHFFISAIAMEWLGRTFLGLATYVAMTFVLAELSLRFFERPIERRRTLFEGNRAWANGLFGLIGCLVLASFVGVLLRP